MDIRPGESKSWLSPSYGRFLGASLGNALVERLAGTDCLFVTLTYDRSKWESPRHLYRAASEERHVRLFIRALAKHLGEDLTGRWLCKLEFQRGGWVHWHIIIADVKYIRHTDLADIWGRGFVWINVATQAALRYVCKYISKDGEWPTFLLAERTRSIKVVRVSPGFWDRPGVQRPPGERRKSARLSIYVPIGQSLANQEARISVRHEGVFRTYRFPAGKALLALYNLIEKSEYNRHVKVRLQSFDALDTLLRASFHLIDIRDPHTVSAEDQRPEWLHRFIVDLLRDDIPPMTSCGDLSHLE